MNPSLSGINLSAGSNIGALATGTPRILLRPSPLSDEAGPGEEGFTLVPNGRPFRGNGRTSRFVESSLDPSVCKIGANAIATHTDLSCFFYVYNQHELRRPRYSIRTHPHGRLVLARPSPRHSDRGTGWFSA
jgi:hypothetical protein